MIHDNDCRLLGEVIPRLRAIRCAAGWPALAPADALAAVAELAGRALAAADAGCACPRRSAA